MSTKEQITVRIAGREHTLNCAPEDGADLAAAALEVDRRVQTLKQSNATLSSEKAIALASLDIAFELTRTRRGAPVPSPSTSSADTDVLSQKLDEVAKRLQGALDV